MKRLRHPVRAIREPFGTAGLIVAIVALILALTGAAFAVSGLNGKQKKEVEKIAKKYAGKPGANGTNGANGSNGAPGAKGDAGAPGANGAPGQSVTGTPIAAGGACGAGVTGVKYILGATSTNVCNGKNGADGLSGFTKTLPPGETETGTFAGAGSDYADFTEAQIPISFNIPLEENGEAFFLDIGETETSSDDPNGCTGTVEAPTAPAGVLCIYTAEEGRGAFEPPEIRFNLTEGEYLPTGTVLRVFHGEGANFFNINGSWAVTAPPAAP